MFYGTEHFNYPLNDWNISNVTNMRHMFSNAGEYNQPLYKWDIRGKNIEWMFYGANKFNQNLSCWDVSDRSDSMTYGSLAYFFNNYSPLAPANTPKW